MSIEKEKSEISCTVMVRIKMDDAIQLILKMELEEGVCAKNWFWGFIISCSPLIILNLFTNNEWISITPLLGLFYTVIPMG